MVAQLLGKAEDSAGLAAERYSIYLEGLEAKQNKAKASWEALWQATIDSDLVGTFYDLSSIIADGITALGGLQSVLILAIPSLIAYSKSAILAATSTETLSAAFDVMSLNPYVLAGTAVVGAGIAIVKVSKDISDQMENTGDIISKRMKDAEDATVGAKSVLVEYKRTIEDIGEVSSSLNWFEKLFVKEDKLDDLALKSALDSIASSSKDWDDYKSALDELSKSTGYLIDETGRLYKLRDNGDGEWKDASVGLSALTKGLYSATYEMGGFDKAVLNQTNTVSKATRGIDDLSSSLSSFIYDGVSLSEKEFGTISDTVANTAFSAAEALGITLQDVEGRALQSSANVGTALTGQYVSFSDLIQQLAKVDIDTANTVASVFANAFAFASDPISNPYAPTVPKFSSGGSGGTSPEKKRIDAEVKSLENKRDAIRDNIAAMKDQIDAQKEALKLQKEEADFLDNIKKKNEDLADIKSEITLLSLDDSEEAKAKRLKLEEDAASLEEEIAGDNADRKYDLQVEALDDFMQKYEDSMNEQADALDGQIDKLKEESSAISSAGGSVSSFGDAMVSAGMKSMSIISSMIDQWEYLDGDTKLSLKEQAKGWLENGMAIEDVIDKIIALRNQTLYAAGEIRTLNLLRNAENDSGSRYTRTQIHHNGGLVENHHGGGFAGGLKTNEVFSKLLKGEYVATENQMDKFMKMTLPNIMSKSPEYTSQMPNGDVSIAMPINIEGNVDDGTLPKIENITKMVVDEINKTLNMRGHLRNSKKFSI